MAKLFPSAGLIQHFPWVTSHGPAAQPATMVATARQTLLAIAGAFFIVLLAAAALNVAVPRSSAVDAEPVGFQPGAYLSAELAAGYLAR